MKRPIRFALTAFVILLIGAPLSLVLTIFLSPLWSWFEESTGIESIGHSGPATWCYLVVFGLLVGATLLGLSVWRQRKWRRMNPRA